jgi:hypothetical protein
MGVVISKKGVLLPNCQHLRCLSGKLKEWLTTWQLYMKTRDDGRRQRSWKCRYWRSMVEF